MFQASSSGETSNLPPMAGNALAGKAWLASVDRSDPTGGWVGKRVLGKGGFGVVGLFEWEGGEKVKQPNDMSEVVIKQGLDLVQEANMLKALLPIKSPHIPKIYDIPTIYQQPGGYVSRARGANTMSPMDYGAIQRIFMEYCPGGDLCNIMRKVYDKCIG